LDCCAVILNGDMGKKKNKSTGTARTQQGLRQGENTRTGDTNTPALRPLHLAMIAVLALVLYANTTSAPFVWDEEPLITNNALVHDLDYFLHPASGKEHPHYDALVGRYVTYLSFALNYSIGGDSVTGYRLVNIGIHAINAVLVYLLAFMIMRTPFMQASALRKRADSMALLTGALFAAHPLMTEAVTYTFQRHASLVATFYILTLVLYSASRHKGSQALYIASIVTALLAMKTKENAFTLPLVVTLYEFMFFRGHAGKRLLRLAPMLLTMAIVPLTMSYLGALSAPKAPVTAEPLETAKHILGRAEYFFTQMPVIAKYLRMLFLPFGQSLDHAYTRYPSIMSLPVMLSMFLHALLAGSAIFLWRISSTKWIEGRLIAFGILWFYITLSVESTFVPLQMIITEYRVYLPATGIFLAVSTGGTIAAMRIESLRPASLRLARNAAVLIVALLGILTIARNATWRTELGIWLDASAKNPDNTRPILHVGLAYEKLGNYNNALKAYQRTVEIDPRHHMAHYDVGVIYNNMGQYDKAEAAFRRALELVPGYALARNNLATILMRTGRTAEAEAELKRAIYLNPWNPSPYFNISLILLNDRRYVEAEHYLKKLMELIPPSADVLNKLGVAYRESGKVEEARKTLTEGLVAFPGNYHLILNLAVLEDQAGDMARAEELYTKTIASTPRGGHAPYDSLASLYIRSGKYREALSTAEKGLSANPADETLIKLRAIARQKVEAGSAR